jgi:hypothetical protein
MSNLSLPRWSNANIVSASMKHEKIILRCLEDHTISTLIGRASHVQIKNHEDPGRRGLTGVQATAFPLPDQGGR